MSRSEIIKMHDLMKQVIIYDDAVPMEERRVAYKPEWNDEKVAKTVSQDLNAVHAANLRVELLGPLEDSKINKEEGRIKKLEDAVYNQTLLLSELSEKYNKLVATLAISRTVDVKHLTLNKKEEG